MNNHSTPDSNDTTSNGLYTLKAARVFPGRHDQCAAARRWARPLLAPFPDAADDVELVLSEFVANAVRHSASGQEGGEVFATLVGLVYGTIHLEVLDQGVRTDASRTNARLIAPDLAAVSGRGLFLAAALSKEWGRLPAEGGPGYAERGYTSIFTATPDQPRGDSTGPMITWADFPTTYHKPRPGPRRPC